MNEIQLYNRIADPMTAVETMGRFLAKSCMFGCENEEQGRVIALTCMTENMSPLEFRRKFHLVNGNPSMRADYMLAEFRQRGGKHKIICRTSERAEADFTSPEGTSILFCLTWDAIKNEPFPYEKDGKSFKKNWRTPYARTQVLWARLCSEAVRSLCPEVVAGVYTPEENGDDAPATPGLDLGKSQVAPDAKAKPSPVAPGEIIEAEFETEKPGLAKSEKSEPAAVAPAATAPANNAPPVAPPVAPPAPAETKSAPAAIFTAVADPMGAGIDGATVAKLLEVIPDEMQAPALKKLVQLKWLKPDAGIGALSAQHAQRIFNNVAGFLARCKEMA